MTKFEENECWMFRVQLETQGVFNLWSMPITVQGEPVAGLQSIVLLPGNTVPFQFKLVSGKKATPVAMVPPPGLTPFAPVGIVAGPRELFSARNDSQFSVSYMMPPPPRRTVRPLPVTSQAKPKRGANLVWSPL